MVFDLPCISARLLLKATRKRLTLLGLAIMMGSVWLRLAPTQESIGPFSNAIVSHPPSPCTTSLDPPTYTPYLTRQFFGSSFMSFMAVAYVPAFLEDRATFVKERANGLYGTAAFMLANFLIGLPYLCPSPPPLLLPLHNTTTNTNPVLISLLFSIITYFLINFRPGTSAFFTYVLWLFLDLMAGESLVVLVASLLPNFVVALAVTAFANGLWMSVGGFLVSPKILNPFWRYVFHYIDYVSPLPQYLTFSPTLIPQQQSYIFQALLTNEFSSRTYSCGPAPPPNCHCMYKTSLAYECLIDGKEVLMQLYGYESRKMGQWAGIAVAILVGLRVLGLAGLWMRKTWWGSEGGEWAWWGRAVGTV